MTKYRIHEVAHLCEGPFIRRPIYGQVQGDGTIQWSDSAAFCAYCGESLPKDICLFRQRLIEHLMELPDGS